MLLGHNEAQNNLDHLLFEFGPLLLSTLRKRVEAYMIPCFSLQLHSEDHN